MKFITTFFFFFFCFVFAVQGQVGIGTNTPHSSAVLELTSNNKGLLIPRMAAPERMAIPTPANSLLVYDLDSSALFMYQISGGWKKINIVSSLSDLITGNNPNDILVWNGTGWSAESACNVFQYYFRDKDGDGKGDRFAPVMGCHPLSGFVADSTDCDDENPSITNFPFYADTDADGYGNPLDSVLACVAPPGYVNNNLDCDDNDPTPPSTIYFADADSDGYGDPNTGIASCMPLPGYVVNNMDCNDTDPTIHPDAIDLPDADFIDSNCDGIDGMVSASVFVSKTGSDSNPGTRALPMLSINSAINKALSLGINQVIVSAGIYTETVVLKSGISLAGGYSPTDWQRSAANTTTISGTNTGNFFSGMIVTGASQVRVSYFKIQSPNALGPTPLNGKSSYAIYGHGSNTSDLTFSNIEIIAGNGFPGFDGSAGLNGTNGSSGMNGGAGNCDASASNNGTLATSSPCGATGGNGGRGGYGNENGIIGGNGSGGAAGGNGGNAGNPSSWGGNGAPGSNGTNGNNGAGAVSGIGFITPDFLWGNWNGSDGTMAMSGTGAGGGGGAGGQYGAITIEGTGNGGGAGGAGGCAAQGGFRGQSGGGSFGIFLASVGPSITIENCSIQTGSGGKGGNGGNAGTRGLGGQGGQGQNVCPDEVGRGGNGGKGGDAGYSGNGGGGSGGASICIAYSSSTPLILLGNTFAPGAGGSFGIGGNYGPSAGNNGTLGLSANVFEF